MKKTAAPFAGALLAMAGAAILGLAVAAGAGTTAAGDAGAGAALRPVAWSEAERASLRSMHLAALPAPPADPSNAVEAHPLAVALGRRLFADRRLSANGQVSCASCHVPERDFQDGLAVGVGVGTGSRRTMPIAGAAHSPWLFWDGRKDSLWAQALGPLEDAAEHGANRMQLVRLLFEHYRVEYEQLFGPLPVLDGLPAAASPLGSAAERRAWAALPLERREAVNRAFANLGKAIAAFERTIRPGASRFDRYAAAVLAGDGAGQQALGTQEIEGLRIFIGKGQCSTCHNGPLLSDQHFHNTGVPPRDPARPDRGRSLAVAAVQRDEFNCLGRYSDAAPSACQELRFIASDDPGLEGAFRTPGLRNVGRRAPYMHAGQFATLEDVVAHYARSPRAAVGHSELGPAGAGHAARVPIRLDAREQRALVAFLRALDGGSP